MKSWGLGHLFTVIIAVFLGIGAVGAIVGRVTADPKAEAAQAELKKRVEARFQLATGGALTLRERMRNPDSFRVSSAIVMSDETVCYRYRSQNGFGGMNNSSAMLFAGIVLSDPGPSFHKLWQKECAGQRGTELGDDVSAGLRQYDKLHNY
jgi:hypothetical protein